MAILRFGQHVSWWSYFQGQKIIHILPRPYFGKPCISVAPKTGIFLFHCQWFWSLYGSQILEICVIMLVEFDQHNDTYFQYLGCIGSPEPLTVKSKNSGFWKNCYTGCPKIRSMEDENDFVTLKIWEFYLALMKTQNCHLFESLSTKKTLKN